MKTRPFTNADEAHQYLVGQGCTTGAGGFVVRAGVADGGLTAEELTWFNEAADLVDAAARTRIRAANPDKALWGYGEEEGIAQAQVRRYGGNWGR